MNKQPNSILIGLFVTGAITLTIAAVIVFGSGSLLQDKNFFILYFKGSVKGLTVGSPVLFRGVKVGAVKDISINASSNSRNFSIPVVVEIGKDLIIMSDDSTLGYESSTDEHKNASTDEHKNASTDERKNASTDERKKNNDSKDSRKLLSAEQNIKALIEQGLRAQLEIQSMVTGQLVVGLDFHPEKPARFSGQQSEHPEIPTIQTDIEEFTQKIKQVPIEEMFNKLFSIISSVEESFNKDSINGLLQSLTLTLQSLNKIADSMDTYLPAITSDMSSAVKNADTLIKNSNSQIMLISTSINKTVLDIQQLINSASNYLDVTGTGINNTLNNADQLIIKAANEITPISKSTKETLTTLKETLKTAKEALNSAKAASEQAGDMVKGIDKVTGRDSELINNLNATLNDLSDAARSLRLLAEYLERHPEALIQGKK